jgi:hypothetical protein
VLETGRTHQIRVHLQYLGHPIPNDPLYGPKANKHSNDEEATIESSGLAHVEFNECDSIPWCEDCSKMRNNDMQYADPTVEQRIMWLHAFYYEGSNFKFTTEYPKWAII